MSNSAQLLQWDIGVLFASSYVRQLSDNVKRSQEQCIKNGQWISKAPYGYKNTTLPSGIKNIEIDPEQSPFVIKIFELYAKGNNSFETVAAEMRAQSFAKTSRGKSITVRTVELILKNPFYMGMMNVKKQLHPHKYPALISEYLFNTVQRIIANHNKSPVQYAGKPILLRGLIHCKNCGGMVTGYIKKQKYVYYNCNNSKRICVKKAVKEEGLLETILSYFSKIQLTSDQINEIANHIEEYEKQEQAAIKQAQRLANEKLTVTKERISKLIDLHIDGKIDAQTYHVKLEEYKREQQDLTLEVKSYNTDNRVELNAAREVLELAKQAKEIFMSSSLDEKQQLLRFFFSNLILDNEKLDLELHPPFNDIVFCNDQHIWRS